MRQNRAVGRTHLYNKYPNAAKVVQERRPSANSAELSLAVSAGLTVWQLRFSHSAAEKHRTSLELIGSVSNNLRLVELRAKLRGRMQELGSQDCQSRRISPLKYCVWMTEFLEFDKYFRDEHCVRMLIRTIIKQCCTDVDRSAGKTAIATISRFACSDALQTGSGRKLF